MNRLLTVVLCSILCGLVAAPVSAVAPLGQPEMQPTSRVVQGQLHVQYSRQAKQQLEVQYQKGAGGIELGLPSLDAIHREAGVTRFVGRPHEIANKALDEQFGLSRWYVIEFPPEADEQELMEKLLADPNVEQVTPVVEYRADVVPNDPMFAQNWGHRNTGQLPNYCWGCGGHPAGVPVGTVGFDAGATSGWDMTQGYGSSSVVIAIIDSGVDVDHPDLNVVGGWDFISGDANPDATTDAHGTNCAGIAAARTNNATGIAGVAGGCGIMALRASNNVHVSNSLIYAADNGAEIISMSFSFPGFTTLADVDAACAYAWGAGLLLMASSSNDNQGQLWVPAIHANVMAIGAASPCGSRKRSSSNPADLNPGVFTDPNSYSCDGERWWGSNWGVNTQNAAGAIELIAPTIMPATDILGAAGYDPGSYFAWFNGTSAACPYAAGVAALVKSQRPTWTNVQIRDRLRATAVDIVDVETVAGWDQKTGYGLVSAARALALPNFVAYQPAGWDAPIVVSNVSGLTVASSVFSASLNGDATNYFTLAGRNVGTGNPLASTSWRLQLDGSDLLLYGVPTSFGPGVWFYGPENAQSLRGGRHSLVQIHDFTNIELEVSETDNRWGIQVVATPVPIAPNTMAGRNAPPPWLAGQADVLASGNPYELCSDGLRMNYVPGVGYWNLGVVHARVNTDNVNLALMNPTAGIFAGQDNPSWTGHQQLNPPGLLDGVLVNQNISPQDYELLMLNQGSYTGPYLTEHRVAPFNSLVAPGDDSFPMIVDQMAEMREIWSGSGGLHRISIEVIGAAAPVQMALFDATFTQGTLADAMATLSVVGGGSGSMDVTLNPTSYYGLAVYRHPVDGNGPLVINLKVRQAVDVIVTPSTLRPISVYSVPNGSGDPISNAWTWNGVVGSAPSRIDASLFVRVLDPGGAGIANYPADEIRLVSSAGGMKPCVDGNIADMNTGPTGDTEFKLPLNATRFSAAGELARILVSDVPLQTTTYVGTGGATGLNIRFNSADISGNGLVDLVDIGDFSVDFGGAYNYRSDFWWDGILDLRDIGQLASAVGTSCQMASPRLPAEEGAGELFVAFDRQGRSDRTALAPGTRGTAYLYLRGGAAAEGVLGWEARLSGSENLLIHDVVLPAGSLNLGEGEDFRVGLGSVKASADEPLLLATISFEVRDDQPAQLRLSGVESPSLGIDRPAAAFGESSEDRLRPLDVAGAGGAVAFVNDGSVGDTPVALGTGRIKNVPNPFNPSTEIWFDLPQTGRAEVRIFDVAGRLVRTLGGAELPAGVHSVHFDGTDHRGARVVSGIYYYELRVDGARVGDTGRMNLVK